MQPNRRCGSNNVVGVSTIEERKQTTIWVDTNISLSTGSVISAIGLNSSHLSFLYSAGSIDTCRDVLSKTGLAFPRNETIFTSPTDWFYLDGKNSHRYICTRESWGEKNFISICVIRHLFMEIVSDQWFQSLWTFYLLRCCLKSLHLTRWLKMSKCPLDFTWAEICLWILALRLNYFCTIHLFRVKFDTLPRFIHNLNSETILNRKYT